MPAETKYIARRSGLFAELMQATELAGFRLEPLPPVSLRDVYFDTPAGDLLRQGYALRVREQGRSATAQLRAIRTPEGLARAHEADAVLEPPLEGDALPELPEGPLRDTLDLLAGEAPLRALLRLRQYRSARVAYDGRRLVGVLSLDVVGYELPSRLHVANEVEIELAGTGRETDLYRLDPVLRARGLDAVARSKFERGVLRLQRDPEDPLLLLPDEREALEALLEAPDPALRRRARVVLLAAKGQREETVSARAGLSPSRVRHWVQRFREGRLAALQAPETELEALGAALEAPPPVAVPSPAFRVSEIVSHGAPTPVLFRPEHFGSEGAGLGRAREEPPPAVPMGNGAAGDGASGYGAPPAARLPIPTEPPPSAGWPEEPDATDETEAAATFEAARSEGPQAEPAAPPASGTPPTPPGEGPPGAPEPETLDDLLTLFDPGPVRTPHLDTEPAPPEVEETGPPDGPEEPGGFVWVEESDGEGTDGPLVAPAEEALPAPPEAAAPPEPVAAPAPVVTAEPAGRDGSGPARPSPARPHLRPAAPVLHAAADVLRYHHARFGEAAARVAAEAAPADVRRALLAAHRVRLALETFADFLPDAPARRLHAGLRGVVRALDALADLDAVAARLDAARETAEAEARPALETAARSLAGRREAARQRAAARLGGALHAQWSRRMERLLALLDAQRAAGLLAGDFFREPPDDFVADPETRPQRVRLRHMLASALWRRYEELRAYEALVGEAGDDLLRPLGVGCAALQFVLGLAAEAAPASTRAAARSLEEAEAALAALHRARATADALRDLAAEATSADSLDALAAAERAEQGRALGRVPAVWAVLAGEDFRAHLAAVAAAL